MFRRTTIQARPTTWPTTSALTGTKRSNARPRASAARSKLRYFSCAVCGSVRVHVWGKSRLVVYKTERVRFFTRIVSCAICSMPLLATVPRSLECPQRPLLVLLLRLPLLQLGLLVPARPTGSSSGSDVLQLQRLPPGLPRVFCPCRPSQLSLLCQQATTTHKRRPPLRRPRVMLTRLRPRPLLRLPLSHLLPPLRVALRVARWPPPPSPWVAAQQRRPSPPQRLCRAFRSRQ